MQGGSGRLPAVAPFSVVAPQLPRPVIPRSLALAFSLASSLVFYPMTPSDSLSPALPSSCAITVQKSSNAGGVPSYRSKWGIFAHKLPRSAGWRARCNLQRLRSAVACKERERGREREREREREKERERERERGREREREREFIDNQEEDGQGTR